MVVAEIDTETSEVAGRRLAGDYGSASTDITAPAFMDQNSLTVIPSLGATSYGCASGREAWSRRSTGEPDIAAVGAT